MQAGMISVEIKYHDFTSCSHQKRLSESTNSDRQIYQAAVGLFRELWNQEPIRLLGIRSSKLSEEGEPRQLSLFDMMEAEVQQGTVGREKTDQIRRKHEQLDRVLDQIRRKYGTDAVKRGSLAQRVDRE